MRTFLNAYRSWSVLAFCGAVALSAALALQGDERHRGHDDDRFDENDESRIRRGFEIVPVELNLGRRNRALVGLGSYLVNAQFGCSDCHTWPQFAPGGSPFLGQPEQINVAGYLGGGRAFGPIVSNNLTPDPDSGLPGDMTFAEFEIVMRTGIDRDHSFPPVPSPDNDLLQVMPWPVFRNITDRDMRALYEYLRAIPSVP
jgi:hypothetical protein